ncbi:MAG: replicative DNA helicase [Microbacteriaceae bacterium]|jgi:replicative DNA helicase|nr:replicative DNA helicase [Microbacteriaceae bacterium]
MAGPQLELVPEGTGDTRVPPNDQAAEMSTLGGMLLSSDAIADVLELVKAEDFYFPKHEIIFNAINTVFARQEPTDVIMITEQLTRDGNLNKIGGASYLHTLESSVPTAANATYYASIVADKAILRKLVQSGTRITQLGYAAEGDPSELVNDAQVEIFAIGRSAAAQDAVVLRDAIKIAVNEMEDQAKSAKEGLDIPTGFRELDDVTNGLQPGQLILIAARPGLGKSTLALDFARSAALRSHVPTVFFSLEMSATEISQRLMSAETSVPLSAIRKSKDLQSEGWKRINTLQPKLDDIPLYIDDSPNLTLSEIRAKCRRLKSQYGIKLVIIDYLQLMTSGKKVENRQQEVSEFSRSLKLLAKELGVPIVALSQLNRGPESSPDKKPQLSHLRESGSLEQDADIVLLLHRERFAEQGENRNDAEIHIAKHRNGEMRVLQVLFEGHYSRFSDLAKM